MSSRKRNDKWMKLVAQAISGTLPAERREAMREYLERETSRPEFHTPQAGQGNAYLPGKNPYQCINEGLGHV
jgi:hypothetical protein